MRPLDALGPLTESWFTGEVVDPGDAVALRTPDDPSFRWGNLLVLPAPLGPGDRTRWEARFAVAFADLPGVRHLTFAWTGADGALVELEAAGYEADRNTLRLAGPERIASAVPAPDGFSLRTALADADWEAVIELQMEDPHGEALDAYRAHRERRAALYRRIADGRVPGLRGAWYLAAVDGAPAGSMGVFVRGDLARFQFVHVSRGFRRRGVATAMVHGVARAAFDVWGAQRAAIMVDEGTPAERIYRRLGFDVVAERYVGACRKQA